MIKALSIRNYALIEELDFSPSDKLSIITGETGAGKSIMLGALGLLLGNRADTKVLWDTSKKCNVEATFDLSTYHLQTYFREADLDYDDESIIRREISPSGKSRAFVNDTPVTLDVLKAIGKHLMDIHSQHESLQLGSNEYQMQILDAFAQHPTLLNDFSRAFHDFRAAKDRYDRLIARAQKSSKDEDYQRFILQELEDLKLDEIDQESLERELSLLENAEEIKLNLASSDQLLDSSEVAILAQLDELSAVLRKLARLSAEFENLNGRIESASIELKDIHAELVSRNESIIHDPTRTEEVKTKLDTLYRMQQKHQVDSVASLMQIRDEIAQELLEVDNLDEIISKAKNDLESAESKMLKLGKVLTDARQHHATAFSAAIEEVIHQIGIENGRVEVVISPAQPGVSGLDHVEVLFSANKGIEPKELKYVASGGEFSRLIFAIKFLLADKTSLPTVIFDEIDTGVSGEIALKMIRMMKKMAKNHQVIAISHLPQFAAGGDKHFFVFKDDRAEKSVTRIQLLSDAERIEAIAKMIGGDNPTNMAFESAKELLTLPA